MSYAGGPRPDRNGRSNGFRKEAPNALEKFLAADDVRMMTSEACTGYVQEYIATQKVSQDGIVVN